LNNHDETYQGGRPPQTKVEAEKGSRPSPIAQRRSTEDAIQQTESQQTRIREVDQRLSSNRMTVSDVKGSREHKGDDRRRLYYDIHLDAPSYAGDDQSGRYHVNERQRHATSTRDTDYSREWHGAGFEASGYQLGSSRRNDSNPSSYNGRQEPHMHVPDVDIDSRRSRSKSRASGSRSGSKSRASRSHKTSLRSRESSLAGRTISRHHEHEVSLSYNKRNEWQNFSSAIRPSMNEVPAEDQCWEDQSVPSTFLHVLHREAHFESTSPLEYELIDVQSDIGYADRRSSSQAGRKETDEIYHEQGGLLQDEGDHQSRCLPRQEKNVLTMLSTRDKALKNLSNTSMLKSVRNTRRNTANDRHESYHAEKKNRARNDGMFVRQERQHQKQHHPARKVHRSNISRGSKGQTTSSQPPRSRSRTRRTFAGPFPFVDQTLSRGSFGQSPYSEKRQSYSRSRTRRMVAEPSVTETISLSSSYSMRKQGGKTLNELRRWHNVPTRRFQDSATAWEKFE
jgi:hypothetical protein